MSKRSTVMKVVAMGLIVALQGLYTLPPAANEPAAALSGTVLSTAGEAAVSGATVHVGNPATGEIVSSTPTDADGRFSVADLEPATYEVAVESDGGLFIVPTPVSLAPGQSRAVDVSINRQAAPDPATAKAKQSKYGKQSLWSNPLTASLIVLGSALVVGVLVDSTLDDDEQLASPSGL